jgi:predicted NAD/FAD-binding protein
MVRCETQHRVSTRKRVAIIGLGMAGATAAHFLQPHHDVVAIEAFPRAGLHHHSVTLDDGTTYDVPLRAASEHYYPNLFKVYRHLGIELRSVNYESTGIDAVDGESYFQYRNITLPGFAFSLPVFPAGKWSVAALLTALVIVRDYLSLVFASPFYIFFRPAELARQSFGEYLSGHGYSEAFVHGFITPVMSTLLSCSYEQVAAYPADLVLEFFCSRATTFFTGWWKHKGVKQVSDKLLVGVECRYDTKVEYVERTGDGGAAVVCCVGGEPEYFDHVVLATDVSVARALLRDPTADEVALLGAVRAFKSNILLHRDASLMPADRRAWSGFNYYSHLPKDLAAAAPRNASMTTAHLARFDATLPEMYETWNPHQRPRDELVVSEAWLSRAVWDVDGHAQFGAAARRAQGAKRIFFAGAYAARGVTLLEQASTSGLDVAVDMGVTLPFKLTNPDARNVNLVLACFSAVLVMLQAVLAFLRKRFTRV